MEDTKEDHGKRLALMMHDLCKKKFICERDNQMDTDEVPRVRHGGCVRFRPSIPTIRRLQLQLTAQWNRDNGANQNRPNVYTSQDVFVLFSGISDDDRTFLGLNNKFARLELMIIAVFPVPPPYLRLTVLSKTKSEDIDLTVKLQNIVKANNELSRNQELEKSDIVIADGVKKLQLHVALFIDSESRSLPEANQKSDRPLSSVKIGLLMLVH